VARPRRNIRTFAVVTALCTLAACGGGSSNKSAKRDNGASPQPPNSTSTTRAPVRYRWPLTGVVTTDAAAKTRPALTVKIENIAASRPQIGVNLADVVYEEVVECNITRLAGVFQSQVPAVVGPIRSVRKTDTELVQPLHGIFAFSGGAPYAIDSIDTAPVVRLDETTAGAAMFRMDGRGGAPHNLFGRGPLLYQHAPSAVGPPHALFQYDSNVPAGAAQAQHVTIGFQSANTVAWDWDPALHSWKRTWNGAPDVVLGGTPITVHNVVVMFVNYTVGQGACNSVGAQAELQASGQLDVFRDGRVIHGTWRYDATDHTQHLFDANGAPLDLEPGNTWVELPKPGYAVTSTP
jgi:hypothetical protein